MAEQYESIDKSQFVFVQADADLRDKKLDSKSRGYFADAFLRFKKNKSSLVAAVIIILLILYAIIVPFISSHDSDDRDDIYQKYEPYWATAAENGWGFLDGSRTTSGALTETQYMRLQAMGRETGMNPIIGIVGTETITQTKRGKQIQVHTYTLKVNHYFEYGVTLRTLSYQDYEKIQAWQKETGIQVLYPIVESKDIEDITGDPAIWYQVTDARGTPKYGGNGEAKVENLIPAYSSNEAIAREYNSTRIEGDPGTWIYSVQKSGSVQVRMCYYNYYRYMHDGEEPFYLFGTNANGQDLFTAVAFGARFSLIFALLVSAINLTIGAIYGAIQGYYGGKIDMIMDRIADILYEVPFVVCVTLFQLHLAAKVGVVPSFLFAFVLTGWIGMAALTRKQFYRFKGQEYVLAARTLGASDWRLMFKHIFPNSLGTIITSCALTIPSVVSSETNMTYLGIVDLSSFTGNTLGQLLSQGQNSLEKAPHALLFPALFFALLLICFNLFGNGLRDAFNPTNRGTD